MSPEMLLREFDAVADAPDGVQRLRELVLQLAVRGKVVPQDPSDEPASVLLGRIEAEKERLYAEGKISKPKKLPPIRPDEVPFGVPEGWAWTRLGVVVDYNGTEKASPNRIPDQAWILELEDVEGSTSRILQRKTRGERGSKSTKAAFQPGDVLYGKLRPYLNKVVVADAPGYCTTEIVPLRPFGDIESHYLRHALMRPDFLRYVNSKSYGMKMPRLGTRDGEAALLPLPPLPEQRRIVEKVDQLMALCDELEERQRQRVQKRDRLNCSALHHLTTAADDGELTHGWTRIRENFGLLYDAPETVAELRQAVLQLAVRGRLVPQDPRDEPASVLLERIEAEKKRLYTEGKIGKPKKLPPIEPDRVPFAVPQGWEWTRLGRVICPDKSISYGVLVPGPDVEAGIPFVRVQDISGRTVPERPSKSIAAEIEAKYSRTRLQGGEILIGVVGSIGTVGIVPLSWRGANIARALCRIAPATVVDRDYLALVLRSRLVQDYFGEATRTLAQPTLNVGQLEVAHIPVPPLPEQRRIVEKVDQLMSLCDELEANLTRSRAGSDRLAAAVVHHLTAA